MIREVEADLKVSFWGVRCFLDSETETMWGVNWFWEILIIPAAHFQGFLTDITVFFYPGFEADVFPCRVLERFEPGKGPKKWVETEVYC